MVHNIYSSSFSRNSKSLPQPSVCVMADSMKNIVTSEFSNDQQYVIVDWYLQQHGSFSSSGRSRDISLIEFSSTQQLTDYLFQYIDKNYPNVNITDKQHTVVDLCQIAIEESNRLLLSNSDEISRVTSRHIWPSNHKLFMGCFTNAHIVATCHDEFTPNLQKQSEEKENENTNYCLITQLGNHPTHVKFVCGTNLLREEILQRFKHPFRTNSKPSQEQYDLFLHKSQTLSIQQLCNYVTRQSWHNLDAEYLPGVLIDFIIAGEVVLFNEQII